MSNFKFILNKNGLAHLYTPVMHEYFTELDRFVGSIFPNEADIEKTLIEIRSSDKKIQDKIEPRYLPFHTRDTQWLIKFFTKQYHRLNGENYTVPQEAIDAYVVCASGFDMKRCDYERLIVKNYIMLLKDRNTDAFMIWKDEKNSDLQSLEYDMLFRAKVRNAMRVLGVSEETVTRSLEYNANLWREHAKKVVYDNKYKDAPRKFVEENQAIIADSCAGLLDHAKSMSEELYQKWSMIYDYEYYQKYQVEIHKVKRWTPAMKLSAEDVRKIKYEFEVLSNEYDFVMFSLSEKIKDKLAKEASEKNIAEALDSMEEMLKADSVIFNSNEPNYWDTHQPAINYNPNTPFGKKLKHVQTKKEKEDYWNSHQPESFSNPKIKQKRLGKVFTGDDCQSKKHLKKPVGYWNFHQPDHNK